MTASADRFGGTERQAKPDNAKEKLSEKAHKCLMVQARSVGSGAFFAPATAAVVVFWNRSGRKYGGDGAHPRRVNLLPYLRPLEAARCGFGRDGGRVYRACCGQSG